jgi:glutathione peroxidase
MNRAKLTRKGKTAANKAHQPNSKRDTKKLNDTNQIGKAKTKANAKLKEKYDANEINEDKMEILEETKRNPDKRARSKSKEPKKTSSEQAIARRIQRGEYDIFNDIPTNFWDIKATNIDGKEIEFKTLKDKKAILIVNTASKCSNHKINYPGLNSLHKKYHDKGLEILAFPSDQFGCEPRSEQEIKDWTKQNYHVDFQLYSKINLNGEDTHPLYKYLRVNSDFHNSETGKTAFLPGNYRKFLLDSNGNVVNFFTAVRPAEKIAEYIKELL